MTKKEIRKELNGIMRFLLIPLNDHCKDCEQTSQQIKSELTSLMNRIK